MSSSSSIRKTVDTTRRAIVEHGDVKVREAIALAIYNSLRHLFYRTTFPGGSCLPTSGPPELMIDLFIRPKRFNVDGFADVGVSESQIRDRMRCAYVASGDPEVRLASITPGCNAVMQRIGAGTLLSALVCLAYEIASTAAEKIAVARFAMNFFYAFEEEWNVTPVDTTLRISIGAIEISAVAFVPPCIRFVLAYSLYLLNVRMSHFGFFTTTNRRELLNGEYAPIAVFFEYGHRVVVSFARTQQDVLTTSASALENPVYPDTFYPEPPWSAAAPMTEAEKAMFFLRGTILGGEENLASLQSERISTKLTLPHIRRAVRASIIDGQHTTMFQNAPFRVCDAFIGGITSVFDCMKVKVVRLGNGTYGTVFKVQNDRDGSTTAWKMLQYELNNQFPKDAYADKLYAMYNEASVYITLVELSRAKLIPIAYAAHVVVPRVPTGTRMTMTFALELELFEVDLRQLIAWPEDDPNMTHRTIRTLWCQRALTNVRDILATIAVFHRAGICHCDIKPPNLVVDRRDGSVRIIDFGLSGAIASTEMDDAEIQTPTHRGAPFGAPLHVTDASSLAVLLLNTFLAPPAVPETPPAGAARAPVCWHLDHDGVITTPSHDAALLASLVGTKDTRGDLADSHRALLPYFTRSSAASGLSPTRYVERCRSRFSEIKDSDDLAIRGIIVYMLESATARRPRTASEVLCEFADVFRTCPPVPHFDEVVAKAKRLGDLVGRNTGGGSSAQHRRPDEHRDVLESDEFNQFTRAACLYQPHADLAAFAIDPSPLTAASCTATTTNISSPIAATVTAAPPPLSALSVSLPPPAHGGGGAVAVDVVAPTSMPSTTTVETPPPAAASSTAAVVVKEEDVVNLSFASFQSSSVVSAFSRFNPDAPIDGSTDVRDLQHLIANAVMSNLFPAAFAPTPPDEQHPSSTPPVVAG